MLYNNFVGLVGNTIIYVVTAVMYVDESTLPINKFFDKEDASYFFIIYCNFVSTYERILTDPSLLAQVTVLCLCGAFGQIFIYFTISLHDSYKVSIITTCRKCFSVVISNVIFGHAFTNI